MSGNSTLLAEAEQLLRAHRMEAGDEPDGDPSSVEWKRARLLRVAQQAEAAGNHSAAVSALRTMAQLDGQMKPDAPTPEEPQIIVVRTGVDRGASTEDAPAYPWED